MRRRWAARTGPAGRLLQGPRGSVLVYATLAMVVLLAFGAGVADMGLMYENRRQMQNAMDAAALAGAQELLRLDLPEADRRLLAETTARNYAERNGVPQNQIAPGYPVVDCSPDVISGTVCVDGFLNRVRMGSLRELDLLVARILNNGVGDVGAAATAVVAPVLPTEGLWPWGVSNCSDWDFDGDIDCGVPQGVPIVLKFSAPPGSPGNFFPLNYPPSGGGASDYGDDLMYGYGNEPGDYIKPTVPWCGTTNAPCTLVDTPHVETEPGGKVGDTVFGVDYLVGMAASSGQDDPASRWNQPVDQCTWPGAPKSPAEIPLPDPLPPLLVPYIPPGWTGGGQPPPSDWLGNASVCYRVGVVPIISQSWSDISGKSPVDIVNWGAFYLVGRTDGPGGQIVVWGYFDASAKVSGGRFSDTKTGLWAARLWE